MGLVDRTIESLKTRRNKILNGEVNSIPSPFPRFSDDFIGIEQKRLFLITSFTKVGKTQFSSYVFLYHTILYAYNNPEKLRIKIFYYPLEETPEQVTLRFMAFLLYYLSKGKVVVSPVDLNSSKNIAIDAKVISLLESEEYQKILKFYEQNVIFSDSTNPSGLWFECQRYAKEHGTIHRTKVKYKDEFGNDTEREKFDHYEPDDPDEYRIIFYDHISLVQPERGMDQRQTMIKLSEYFVLLRNRYGFSAVIIQQQTISDNLDAFKANKLRPTIANLGDAKTIARDVDVCIGLFSPYRYELSSYLGYDVTKLKDNLRFAEILINRHGSSNGIIGLLFLGQCNFWSELPPPSDTQGMNKIYQYLNQVQSKTSISLLMISFKKFVKNFLKSNQNG